MSRALDTFRESSRTNTSAERLQTALTVLAKLDQAAETDRITGHVTVTIRYQEGIARKIEAERRETL